MSKNSQAGRRSLAVVAAATVIALAAGGGAVAGSLITSKDIQDKTITSADLHKNSVKTQKVKDGSLRLSDLNQKANDAIKKGGPQGPAGPAGATGPQGPKGPKGSSAGISAAGSGYDTVWPADGQVHETVETCAAGEYITGGGFSTFGGAGLSPTKDLGGDNPDIQITVSAPYIASDSAYVPISDTNSRFYADRWVVRGYNNGSTEQVVRAWALCAPLPAS
jgi:hypothetical protein